MVLLLQYIRISAGTDGLLLACLAFVGSFFSIREVCAVTHVGCVANLAGLILPNGCNSFAEACTSIDKLLVFNLAFKGRRTRPCSACGLSPSQNRHIK